VVPRRVFLGPALRVALVFAPLARVAECFGCPAPRPAPLITDLRPGFPAGASTLFFGRVPVSLWRLPFPRFMWPPRTCLVRIRPRQFYHGLLVRAAAAARFILSIACARTAELCRVAV
jgi:hypothetical protein